MQSVSSGLVTPRDPPQESWKRERGRDQGLGFFALLRPCPRLAVENGWMVITKDII